MVFRMPLRFEFFMVKIFGSVLGLARFYPLLLNVITLEYLHRLNLRSERATTCKMLVQRSAFQGFWGRDSR